MDFHSLQFKYTWRPYQERVLTAIDNHLDDKRLHIVAAPGAGKTTLGLEVFRRLGKAAIALSPTRVIRDQWIGRLEDFGASEPRNLGWVSSDIHNPKFFTSITYQALHSRLKNALDTSEADPDDDQIEQLDDTKPTDTDVDKFVELLTENQIKVLILDVEHDEWETADVMEISQVAPNEYLAPWYKRPRDYVSEDVEYLQRRITDTELSEIRGLRSRLKKKAFISIFPFVYISAFGVRLMENLMNGYFSSELSQNGWIVAVIMGLLMASPWAYKWWRLREDLETKQIVSIWAKGENGEDNVSIMEVLSESGLLWSLYERPSAWRVLKNIETY